MTVWRWLTGALTVLVAVVCAVIISTFTPPVVLFPVYALASAVLLFLGALWLVLALIGWFKYHSLRWTAVAPAIVIVTAALVLLSVPSKGAFAVSKGALETVAQDCTKSTDTRRIGAYAVRSVRPTDSGCLFFIVGGLIDSIGLAYLPDGAPYLGEPRRDGDIGYERYDGDWYRFVQQF